MATGICCVACGSQNLRVLETRDKDNCVYRRRECKDCGARFSTAEEPVGETTRKGRGGGVVTRSEEMQAAVTRFMEAFAELTNIVSAAPTQAAAKDTP